MGRWTGLARTWTEEEMRTPTTCSLSFFASLAVLACGDEPGVAEGSTGSSGATSAATTTGEPVPTAGSRATVWSEQPTSGDTTSPTPTSTSTSTSPASGTTTPPTSDATSDATSASTGTTGPPDWVDECAMVGIEIVPVPPASDEEWIVRFVDDEPLVNIGLAVTIDDQEIVYGVDNTDCSMAPPYCWDFAPWVDPWPPGQLILEIRADDFMGATCEITLE